MSTERQVMTERISEADLLVPSHPAVREATASLLARQLGHDEVEKYLDQLTSASVPAPIGADATVKLAIYGNLLVDNLSAPYSKHVYNHTIWGGPAALATGTGFMYTAYNTWDAFFQNVTSCHVQGWGAPGGILQVNWFIANGTPVGQFNGVVGGIVVFEAGGAGTWS
jgi:hypothetical protein